MTGSAGPLEGRVLADWVADPPKTNPAQAPHKNAAHINWVASPGNLS